jgi:hypothetical protein
MGLGSRLIHAAKGIGSASTSIAPGVLLQHRRLAVPAILPAPLGW